MSNVHAKEYWLMGVSKGLDGEYHMWGRKVTEDDLNNNRVPITTSPRIIEHLKRGKSVHSVHDLGDDGCKGDEWYMIVPYESDRFDTIFGPKITPECRNSKEEGENVPVAKRQKTTDDGDNSKIAPKKNKEEPKTGTTKPIVGLLQENQDK